MKVRETLEVLTERLQVAMVVCEHDGKSSLKIVTVNNAACMLFGYTTPRAMFGLDVKQLMPPVYAEHHDSHIDRHMKKRSGIVQHSSIMGQWRELEAMTNSGQTIPVLANVADVQNSEERFFVAIFQDRRPWEDKKRELESATLAMAAAKEQAEQARNQAEAAHKEAEANLMKQKKLSAQVSLLRQIFGATVGLVVLLAVLVVVGWNLGEHDKESLAMFERILLVLTGMLGSAMAGVFDTRVKEKE
jgi:PAS domain S-box-containing protein